MSSESSSGPSCSRSSAVPAAADSPSGRTSHRPSLAAAAVMTGSVDGDGSNDTIRPRYPRARSRSAKCPRFPPTSMTQLISRDLSTASSAQSSTPSSGRCGHRVTSKPKRCITFRRALGSIAGHLKGAENNGVPTQPDGQAAIRDTRVFPRRHRGAPRAALDTLRTTATAGRKRAALVTYIELRSNRDFPHIAVDVSAVGSAPRRRTGRRWPLKRAGLCADERSWANGPVTVRRRAPGGTGSDCEPRGRDHATAHSPGRQARHADRERGQEPGHQPRVRHRAGRGAHRRPHVPVQDARPRPHARVLAERGRGLSRHRVHHRQRRAEPDLRARPWRRADQRHGPGAGPLGGPLVDRPQ